MKKTLAVETSCDDTCVAIVQEDGRVELSFKQDQDEIHRPFGGVVPERASRNHSLHLLPLIDRTLKTLSMDDLSVFSCCSRPGLMGSLLVGWVTVKTLSVLYKKPFIGVNHIEGHIVSPFIYDHIKIKNFDFPYIVLVVSGGHTHLFLAKNFSQYVLLGRTLDDAAGEAFDKFAKLLGLPYPGGVQVDEKAKWGDPARFSFPVALSKKENLNFSFSGLKTSAALLLKKMSVNEINKHQSSLCASFQEAVVNQLVFKLDECVKKYPKYKNVAVVGGVSSNSRLRSVCQKWARDRGLNLIIPPLRYCTDNAGMIGYAGLRRFLMREKSPMHCSPYHDESDFIKM